MSYYIPNYGNIVVLDSKYKNYNNDNIIYNKDDLEMLNTFRKSLLLASNETYNIEEEDKDSEIKKIIKTEDALLYLGLKLRENKRYS